MVLGGGLLPCLRTAMDAGGSVVRRRQAIVVLDAQDAEADLEAGGGEAGAAFRGRGAQSAEAERQTAGGFQTGVPVSASATAASAVRGVSAAGSADRQWGDGSGLQDRVHAASETVGDAVAESRRAEDSAVTGDLVERCVDTGL